MKEIRKYKKNRKVPEPTLKRLPGYLYYLDKVKEQEVKVEETFEEEIEFETKATRDNKAGFMTTLKKVFTDIFDEEDAEM